MAVLLEPIVMMTKSFISKPDEKKFVKMKSNFALVYLVSGMLVPKFRFIKQSHDELYYYYFYFKK